METSFGSIQGIHDSNDLLVFKGIPYAADTSGGARFLPAQDREPWSGVRDASNYGAFCPQISIMPGFENQSEDCLFTNVWTPSLSGARPVMVWFHGGAYNATSELAEGAQLAQRGDIVVVTVNHRLNAFGFLQLAPELGHQSASHPQANQGPVITAGSGMTGALEQSTQDNVPNPQTPQGRRLVQCSNRCCARSHSLMQIAS